jgi:hypothetical protein
LVGLLRAYIGGFVIAPLPAPSFRSSTGGEPRANILTGNDSCTVTAEAVDSIYVLRSTFSSHADDVDSTHRAPGGDAWNTGSWRRVASQPPDAEIRNRPRRGFFRD